MALVHSNTSVVLGGAIAAAARAGCLTSGTCARSTRASVAPGPPTAGCCCSAARPALRLTRERGAVRRRTARRAVVYDGLAVERAARALAPAARERLGLDAAAPTIAVLGRISDWKGQDVLVRALADPMLRERGALGADRGRALAGREDRLARVLALARSLGVRDRVRLLGFREDVETVYGAADVVAVPSTAPDPLPGSALEAAAAGCAVVAAAHGGLPEIIRDGETGRLFAPRRRRRPGARDRPSCSTIDGGTRAPRRGGRGRRARPL